MKIEPRAVLLAGLPVFIWGGFGRDAQHAGLSGIAAQALNQIHWSAPVDLNPAQSSYQGELLIHYGSPVVTAANTVLIPVKTAGMDGFEIQARSGANGTLLYTLATDYTMPPHLWVPPYGIALSTRVGDRFSERTLLAGELRGGHSREFAAERLYYPGAGGTIYFRDQVDSPTGPTGQIAFYGNGLYTANMAAFNAAVQISTPLTADRLGNIYFGFVVQAPNPANLTSGIARIASDGTGTWMSAAAFAGGDAAIVQVAFNCAPALSPDQRTLYFAVSDGMDLGAGYLVSANSTSLAPLAHIRLTDPKGGFAIVATSSSASPTVGPDGDVYFGVLENGCTLDAGCSSHNDRGWMLHFDAALAQTRTPGSFGWDDTASIVPANLAPGYSGPSSYLILVKYNNYAGSGTGDGVNKLAILDPNATGQDEYSSTPVQVMREVLTVTGVTPDPQTGFPNAVKEWCINAAAIDPSTNSVLVSSEDGVLYRWDLRSNAISQRLRLTPGLGEAYTPTIIGADGTVYAINDATLFAVGN